MAQNSRLLPAYPLFVKDPYFSIWSAGDVLNETDASFWTGKSKKIYGIIQANGKSYSFLGVAKSLEKLTQTSVVVTTFRTKCVCEIPLWKNSAFLCFCFCFCFCFPSMVLSWLKILFFFFSSFTRFQEGTKW